MREASDQPCCSITGTGTGGPRVWHGILGIEQVVERHSSRLSSSGKVCQCHEGPERIESGL